ncbi:hypothetical protein D3C78_1434520 [compost metagenome]
MRTEGVLRVVDEVRMFTQEVAAHELHDGALAFIEQTTYSINQLSVSTLERGFQRSTRFLTDRVKRHRGLVVEEVTEIISYIFFERGIGDFAFTIKTLGPRQLFNHDFVQVEVNRFQNTLHV